MRFRQVEKLLFAFHQADAGHAAGTHGDQRLINVKADALRVALRMEEHHHARQPPRHKHQHVSQHRDNRHQAGGKISEAHAGHIQNGSGDAKANQRRTQVRLLHYERGKKKRRNYGRQKRVPPVVDGLGARFQKERQKKNKRGLGQL